jgi:predicted HTH transcriptional regulator
MDKRNGWLEIDGGVYQFAEDVKVFFYEHTDLPLNLRHGFKSKTDNSAFSDTSEETDLEARETSLQSNLNHRQMAILSTLDQQKYINAAQCAGLYDVSKVTATRDLTELWKIGLIGRIGKGRATRYGRAAHFKQKF